MPDEPDQSPPPNIHLLRCLACGKTVECQPADMHGFTRTRWPKCCGNVMALFGPVEKPTPPERPGLD